MNTILHMGATGALFWLSIYAFDDLSEGVLGVAALAAALAFFVLTILTLGDDRDMIRKFRGKREEDS